MSSDRFSTYILMVMAFMLKVEAQEISGGPTVFVTYCYSFDKRDEGTYQAAPGSGQHSMAGAG